MQIQILRGVKVDGEPLQPLVAAAVTALLVADGPLTDQQLRRTLWEHGKGSLPNVLTKLRQRLGDRFVEDRVGYRLEPRPEDHVDLTVFGQLVNRAAVLRRSDPETAVLLYDRALMMWAVPPLPDLPATTALDAIRQRLLLEWMDEAEKRAELQFRLGHLADLITRTPQLLALMPEGEGWEHLRALYLRALYLKGHKTRALKEYQEYREQIHRHIGAPPGAELTELRQEILTNAVRPLEPLRPRAGDAMVAATRADPSRVSLAAICNYNIGGDYHLPVDRAAGEVLRVFAPEVAELNVQALRFHARLIRNLLERRPEDGGPIAQILELGVALPSALSAHEVAAALRPDTRIVYASKDPAVIRQWRRIPLPDTVTVVEESLADPASLLENPDLLKALDLSVPTLVSCLDEHNFRSDAGPLITEIMNEMAPGSLLALTVPTAEGMTDMVANQLDSVFANSDLRIRLLTLEQAVQLVPGLELEPLVYTAEYASSRPYRPGPFRVYALVGRKP